MNTEHLLQVQTLVKDKLTAEGLTIKSEGAIKSNVIDTRTNQCFQQKQIEVNATTGYNWSLIAWW